MRSRKCNCGHKQSAHRGPKTECTTWLRAEGRNAIGARLLPDLCPCAAFHPRNGATR